MKETLLGKNLSEILQKHPKNKQKSCYNIFYFVSSVVGQPVVFFLFKYQLKLKFPDLEFFVVTKAHKKIT